ncbi:DNA polymerase delta small subunit Cdc1 [Cryptotrichosporon argae]
MASEIAYSGEAPLRRATADYTSLPELSAPFLLDPATRSYKHQYSNIYFVRLVELRPVVEANAARKWKDVRGQPPLLPRILNVQRSQLCYIVGTVYMEMPLKPNVLEDMARDHWIAPPAPRPKFFSAQDAVHLEDESGRVRLVGDVIRRERDREGGGLVTGVIMAALGLETGAGDFEVIDLCFAGLSDVYHPQSSAEPGNGKGKGRDMDMDLKEEDKTWVALVSGLSAGSNDTPADMKSQLLVEWLMGESGGLQEKVDASRIARLILAGNSLTAPVKGLDDRKPKRFTNPTKPLFQSHPTSTLSNLLADVLGASLPVTLVPGPHDPAGATLPQQPLPKIMFGGSKMRGLECGTNPLWTSVGDRSFFMSGGQTIDDIFKYLPSTSRLAMARRTLEWQHIAPTAPDTLWIYPFSDADPFVIRHRPDVYVVGNQPEFETALVGGDADGQRGDTHTDKTRIVMLPSFAETGLVALVCLETLECRTINFEVPAWIGDEDVKME